MFYLWFCKFIFIFVFFLSIDIYYYFWVFFLFIILCVFYWSLVYCFFFWFKKIELWWNMVIKLIGLVIVIDVLFFYLFNVCLFLFLWGVEVMFLMNFFGRENLFFWFNLSINCLIINLCLEWFLEFVWLLMNVNMLFFWKYVKKFEYIV